MMDTSIIELITDNLVSSLEAMTVVGGYDFAPAKVEQERSRQIIGDNYPFEEVAGPLGEIEPKITEGDEHVLHYVITHLDKLDDTSAGSDPLPKQVASVVANLHKAIMADHTRAGYAVTTAATEYGYINYDAGGVQMFEVYLMVDVTAIIDMFDMSKQG